MTLQNQRRTASRSEGRGSACPLQTASRPRNRARRSQQSLLVPKTVSGTLHLTSSPAITTQKKPVTQPKSKQPATTATSKQRRVIRLPVEKEDQRTLEEEEEAERKLHLDAYYKKKLLYLEEKSKMIDRLRRKQEKEDLQFMAAVPKVGERSQKLAELYRLRQKLIEDDLFLRKAYDRDTNRFAASPDPHYALDKKKSAHSPLPAFNLAGSPSLAKKRSTSAKKPTASSRSVFGRPAGFAATDLQQLDRHNFYEREKQFLAHKASNGHLKRAIDAEKKLDRSPPSPKPPKRLRPAKSQSRLKKAGDSEEVSRSPPRFSPEPLPKPLSNKQPQQQSRPRLEASNSKPPVGTQAPDPHPLPRNPPLASKPPSTDQSRPKAVLPHNTSLPFTAAAPQKPQAKISPLVSPANRGSPDRPGEFFARTEEDRVSLSPSAAVRKDSHFLAPAEIIKSNSQLMKKSRQKQSSSFLK